MTKLDEILWLYPDKAVVKEEAEGGGSCDEGLLKFLLDCISDKGLNIRACAFVEISPELSIGSVA